MRKLPRDFKLDPPGSVSKVPLEGMDGIEVSPCELVNGYDDITTTSSRRAQFWSVYRHLEEGGVSCIGDFKSSKKAYEFARALLKRAKKAGLEMPYGISSGAM